MKKLLFVYFSYFAFIANAQQVFPIKESYDQLLEPYYTSSTYSYTNDQTSWWSSWMGTLSSYLRMYETTKDKAYLNKFIKHSYGIQMRRSLNPPIWLMMSDDDVRVLRTGQLLSPMAEFVYIVKNDLDLYNTNLPFNTNWPTNIIPTNNLSDPTYTILGYGDYANWLQARTEATLNYMIDNYWIDNTKCFGKTPDPTDHTDPIEFNYNASYAAAMFYLGSANVDPTNPMNYTSYAEDIVTYFKNNVRHLNNQSKVWHHDPSNQYEEDVGHGPWDMQIPVVAYKLYGNGLYQTQQLDSFAHTFTLNIWDADLNFFHNTVYGHDGGWWNPDISTPNYFWSEIPAWMCLNEFYVDNTLPNTFYNIILDHTIALLTNDLNAHVPQNRKGNTYLFDGTEGGTNGVSEVVKAQWDKECQDMNLTLFNRHVVYDQEFKAGNILTIAPQEDFPSQSQTTYYHAGDDDPFADPPFNDGGPKDRFVVEPGTNVNFIAGDKIVFKPGTHLKAGCNAHAYIDPDICSHPKQMIPTKHEKEETGYNNSTTKENKNREPETTTNLPGTMQNKGLGGGNSSPTDLVSMFAIYPNPTNQIVYIAFTISSEALISIKITDIIGKEVFGVINEKEVPAGNYIIPYNFVAFSKGIYVCTFKVNGQAVRREKIVFTE